MKSELIEYYKMIILFNIILWWPFCLVLILSVSYKFDFTIFLILLVYYISLIPIGVLYIYCRDRKISKEKIEMRNLEEKVFRKNLKK